jgi:Fic family protein
VAKIDALAKVIHGIPLPPAVQRRIDSLNIMRAVRGTTGIEGTEVSETEVEKIILSGPGERVLSESRERAEKEVRNADKVMRFVASTLQADPETPVTEELVCTLHRLTTEGIDYQNNDPGMYRTHSVVVGTYVPPRTGDEVRDLMKQFVEWFNEGPPKMWPSAVQAVAAHFYLISVHPFGDGNGRTARGLESFLLYKGGINARGFYSLANFYYQHRPEYVAMLDHVRFNSNGDVTPFIKFALSGLVIEQEAVHGQIFEAVKTIAFRDLAREVLDREGKLTTKPGQRMFHFLLDLADGESVSIGQLRKGGHHLSRFYHGLAPRTVRRDLDYLVGMGLIKMEGDIVTANVDVMGDFMPSSIAQQQPS